MEEDYKNREIDEKFDSISDKLGTKIDTGIEHVSDRVATFEKDTRESLSRIEAQVAYTNGKVRKLIMSLILVFGILIGQNFTTAHQVISLVAHVL